jgi:hypothetical protein
MGERAPRKMAMLPLGWHDSPPDLTTGVHDLMAAMIESARKEVRIDLSSVPLSRYEEALAAKITAYEWLTSDDNYLMSFRSVCLHLTEIGFPVDADAIRKAVLKDVAPPTGAMPDRWQKEYEYQQGRRSRGREYVKLVKRERRTKRCHNMPEEIVAVLPADVMPQVDDYSPCPALDDVSASPFAALAVLAAIVNPLLEEDAQVAAGDVAAWIREADEAVEGDD